MQMPNYELAEAIDLTKRAIESSDTQWIDHPEAVAEFMEKMHDKIKELSKTR